MGNLAGFGCVLVLTGLLRITPLNMAYPISQGLSLLAVQIVGARLLFGEKIAPLQRLGALLVLAGIVLVGSRR